MKYKKVFSSTRFTSVSQSRFRANARTKSIVVGSREIGARTAFIGKVIEQGRTSNLLDYAVQCDVSFPHVVGIFGSRGSGKSFDLGVLLEGIFLSGTESTSDSAIVFDVQDQFWTLGHQPSHDLDEDMEHLRALSRWGLEPASIQGLRIWVPAASDTHVPNAKPFSIAANQLTGPDWLAILELERFSAMGELLLTVLKDLGHGTPEQLAEVCGSEKYLSRFQQATIDGVRWRLNSLHGTKIISSPGIDIDHLLRPGALTIVLMRNLSESVRGLVVGVITRLVADRLGRAQQARRVALRTNQSNSQQYENLSGRLWLVLDEAHVLVPSDGTTAASAPLIDYVKRGRDAGLSLIFATQQPSAVNSKLMSQVDLTITHTLGFDADLSAATARMPTRTRVEYEINNQKVGSVSDVLRSLAPGEAFVADSNSERIFLAKIRPRLSAHGGSTPR